MKKLVTTFLLSLAMSASNAQDSISTTLPVIKELQTPQSYLDSIKKTFENHKAVAEIDKKWMEELLNDDLFTNMENDISNVYLNEDVEYALPTELLKARLENLNKKSAFNVQHNETVEKVIKNFLKKRSKSYERLMALSEYYFPLFEERLAQYDVPLEIKYLAIVESALNPKAKSRVGATGLWQFMYPTGKQYGLDVNTYVDERSDPIKSTEAAVKYLRDLHNIFGSWELVLASYNAGPGTVSKAIRRAGGETDYWKLRNYLPKETQGYVPAFIATMYMYEYHKEHGIQPKRAAVPFIKTDTVMVKRALTFQEISKVIDLPVEEIKLMNPKYKLDKIPHYEGSSYALRLPLDKIGRFASNERKIYAYLDYVDYYEKENARRKKLIVPSEKVHNETMYASESNSDSKKVSTPKYHKVRKGDTLGKIASANNLSVDQLKRMNGLKSSNLQPGAQLKVGESTKIIAVTSSKSVEKETEMLSKKPVEAKLPSTVTASSYVVQKGDTLHAISKKIGNVSVAELMKINNIKNPSELKAGMVLKTNS